VPSRYPIQHHTLSRHDPRIPEYAPERLKHERIPLADVQLADFLSSENQRGA
jgi:hypothetical protein